jgi:hypothetical protein
LRWIAASGLAGGANSVVDGQRLEPAAGRVKREIVKRHHRIQTGF